MKTSIVADIGDGAVTHWRIDKISDKGMRYTKVCTLTLKEYPHSGAHALKVAWERHNKLFRKLSDKNYYLVPQQLDTPRRKR